MWEILKKLWKNMELSYKKVIDLSFADLEEGKIYQFTRKITPEDVLKFSVLTGDYNPLHVDKKFGEKSQFKQNIVHGMLVGSLFSTLVGMHCPGKKSLYLSQTLNFKIPLFYNDTIIVRGTIIGKNEAVRLITLKTEIIKEEKVCVHGEARIKMIE